MGDGLGGRAEQESLAERGPRLAREYLRAFRLQSVWYRDCPEGFGFGLVVEKMLGRRVDRAAGLLEHWLKRAGEPLLLRSRNWAYRFTIDFQTGHVRLHRARLSLAKAKTKISSD